MQTTPLLATIALGFVLGWSPVFASDAGLAVRLLPIPAGTYAPLYRTITDAPEIKIAAFLLDDRPVTNAEFLAFVTANPKWRRSQISPLFADTSYLEYVDRRPRARPRAPGRCPGRARLLVRRPRLCPLGRQTPAHHRRMGACRQRRLHRSRRKER